MKILLIGKNGQVGWELQRSLSTLGDVVAVDYFDKELCGDLTNLDGIAQTVRTVRPDVVVNAAAHTAVDKAESERELSDLLNDKGVAVLAAESAKLGALMVHYSTDYVFDGAGSHYRREDEATGPLNVYGETKRAGELALEQGNPRHLIFRTSWVYATRGANFAKTMLRLAGEKETLSIIDDQHGAPTGAELLADCTATAIRETLRNPALAGTYHLVASGETSWCDYARYVFEVARAHGAELAVQEVKGIPTTAYPTPAKRPLNSRLSNEKFQQAFGVTLPDWRQGVARVVTCWFLNRACLVMRGASSLRASAARCLMRRWAVRWILFRTTIPSPRKAYCVGCTISWIRTPRANWSAVWKARYLTWRWISVVHRQPLANG